MSGGTAPCDDCDMNDDAAMRDEEEAMSSKYVVCPHCGGEGTVDRLGAMTSDYLDEEFGHGDEREEFLRDYHNGRYDAVCPTCDGRTTITAQQMTEWEDLAEVRAIEAAERAMGA